MITEIVAIVFFLVCYIIVGIFIAKFIYEKIDNEPYICEITTFGNQNFIRSHPGELAFATGVSWLLLCFFTIGIAVSYTFYEKFIIKGDEENRIASWFV